MNAKTLAIAIAAGFASAFAVYASIRAGGMAVPLLSIAPLPVYVAALAWGTRAGVGASVAAIVCSALLISPQAAVAIGLTVSIPASIVGHQANLAQENERGGMDWYPLPRLLFNLALSIAGGLILVGFFMDYASYSDTPELAQTVREYLRNNPPPQQLSDEDITLVTQTVFRMLPFMFAGIWLVIHVINLQLGAVICRMSNMLPRPKDDVPATANLPKAAVVILFVSLLGTVLLDGGMHGVAAVIAGTFLMAFSLVGLAGAHLRARNNPASFIFLILGYILILVFFIPIFFFAIGGIARSISNTQPPRAGANKT